MNAQGPAGRLDAAPWAAAIALGAAAAACGGGGGGETDGDGDATAGEEAPEVPMDAADASDADEEGPPSFWRPAPGTSWQIQFSGDIDTSFEVAMYDLDLFDTPGPVIEGLRARGIAVVCYFSGGSYEDWRSDRDAFPETALGNPLEGWPGERWLDVRSDALRPIMQARLDLAAARGCDGVDPDNMDGYANDSGFDLSYEDQLAYNRFIAAEAHARGLSVGLKNDLGQIEDLVDDFDWQLNEECHVHAECDLAMPFIDAHKAVFNVEYGDMSLVASVCPDANQRGFDTLIKQMDLGSFRIACR
jgi:hypothetical protein